MQCNSKYFTLSKSLLKLCEQVFNEIETNTMIYCKMANITCLSNMTALSQGKKEQCYIKIIFD